MRALHWIDTKSTAAAALLTIGAALVAGCGTRELADARLQAAVPASTASPMAVSCEPNQRAIVRPVVINGAAISQVECVTSTVAAGAAPVAYQPAAGLVPAAYYPQATAQPAVLDTPRAARYPSAAPQHVSYQRVPERVVRTPKRSVAKSAVIIGSSAGAGAGLGAMIGGKKGALIGAAVGGGGATLWDQVTRRNR